jgi:hypothetical protein
MKQGGYGVRMCLKGDNKKFKAPKPSWFHGLPQPHEAEAYSLKGAIAWIGKMNLTAVPIEFYRKQVVDSITIVNPVPTPNLS